MTEEQTFLIQVNTALADLGAVVDLAGAARDSYGARTNERFRFVA